MSAKLAKRLVSPDFLTGPKYVETYGPEVADLCASADFAPDPQQELALDRIFAIRPDGSPATFEFCVVCCRQNLKTGLFKQAALGWLYVTEQGVVVWSAHEMGTTREAHRDLADLIKNSPALRRRLKATSNEGIYDANGEERIELATGQRLLFKARTLSGGRGLTGDKTILDEAFALRPSHLGSLIPTMMARPDGQVLYGSSAGKADSVSLQEIRDRGRAGSSKRLTYLEWLAPFQECADPHCEHPKTGVEGCALDDPELWRRANPTISTGRITVESIADQRQALPPDEFMRECLGWWDEVDEIGSIFPGGSWHDCATDDGPGQPAAIGVAVSVDRAWTSIGVASSADVPHIGAHSRGRGVSWVVVEAKRIQTEHGVQVVVDGKGPAESLIDQLREAGVVVTVASTEDYLQACADLFDRVQSRDLEHGNYDDLNDAVAVATWRTVGDRRAWARKHGDVSMLEAVTLALWGATQKTTFNIW